MYNSKIKIIDTEEEFKAKSLMNKIMFLTS